MPADRTGRRIGRAVALTLLTAAVVLVGWAFAVAAFLATAAVVHGVALAFVVAAVACLVVAAALSRLVARVTRRARPYRYAGGVGVAAVVVLAVLAASTVLRPLPSTPASRRLPTAPAGVRYWQLSTGSRIAYVEMPAAGRPSRTPIVLVGGGPGEADVGNRSQTRFFARFARLGYDVYSYDQVGAGLSSRLADPSQYTVERHVADLDAIRQRIGARRLVLLGSSWGGSLVASYLARHPGHVAKAILTSPAQLDYAGPYAGSASSRLPPERRQRADALLPGNPRFLFWYALGGVDPAAAHDLVSDREADAYFDGYLDVIRPATVCDPAHLPDDRETGNGFYDNIFTTRSAKNGAQSGVASALARDRTPVLVVTGDCNYVPWEATRRYATTLPNATLVCLPHAGHVVYLDQPDAYARTVTSFLRGTRLPVPPWRADRPCTA